MSEPALEPEGATVVVLATRRRETPPVAAHIRQPMSDAERRRNAARGIAKARRALARRVIRGVPDDG